MKSVYYIMEVYKSNELEECCDSPKSLLQKASSVSFDEEASSSSQSRQLA